MAKSSAPDIFMGMTHQWCGQYDFCDRMPADLAKTLRARISRSTWREVGKWKGVRYGIPIEHGNFQQMYINVDMFKKAGLNPDNPPTKFTGDWLAAMKKLTIARSEGRRSHAGRVRHPQQGRVRSASPTSSFPSRTPGARAC